MAKRFLCYETNTPPQNVSKGGVLQDLNALPVYDIKDFIEHGTSEHSLDFNKLPYGCYALIGLCTNFNAHNGETPVTNSNPSGSIATHSYIFVVRKRKETEESYTVKMIGDEGIVMFTTNGSQSVFTTKNYALT